MADRPDELLFEDLVDADGNVDLDDLVEAATEADVVVGAMADEDLAWFSPGSARRLDPRFDAPRLARLDDDGFRVAMDTAFAVLAARGELQVDDDGRVTSAGPRGFVVGLQQVATRRMRVEVATSDGPQRLVLHRLPEDLVLFRRVGLGGIHHVGLARSASAAAAVAGTLDPDGRASTSSEVQRTTDPEALDPPVSTLAESAEVTATVEVQGLADGRPTDEDGPVLTTFALPDRLVLTRGPREGVAGPHTARAVSPRDLLDVLRSALLDEE